MDSELSPWAGGRSSHRSSTGGPCNSSSLLLYFLGLSRAGVAQLVEHLICNQRVGGSNPSASSAKKFLNQGMIPVFSGRRVSASRSWRNCVSSFYWSAVAFYVVIPPCGRVGEWLKPADCKSAAPCGLRRFESSPVHHLIAPPVKPRSTDGALFISKLRRSVKSDGARLSAYRCHESGLCGGTNLSSLEFGAYLKKKDCAACGKQNSPG